MATLSFRHVNKIYEDNTPAVIDFNLEIKDQEFVVFVGPSGCGKSTTLRMVAGLEEISSGEIYIDDELINDIQPKDRNIAMVFQSYALYPHMSVYDNMAFSLKLKKVPKNEIKERVNKVAELLDLTTYLSKKPKSLSGGQRQRVALGRAIIRNPKVFLMDEPLSNLDAKLRIQMRSVISEIHKKVQATTIYVTHDQTEAMTLADRIVIMNKGVIQQIGTPMEIYDNPTNIFVAGFIGSPSMNFIEGTVHENLFIIDIDNEQKILLKLSKEKEKLLKKYNDKEVILGIRPDEIIVDETKTEMTLPLKVYDVEYLGKEAILYGTVGNKKIASIVDYKKVITNGFINIFFNDDKTFFFDKETTLRITSD